DHFAVVIGIGGFRPARGKRRDRAIRGQREAFHADRRLAWRLWALVARRGFAMLAPRLLLARRFGVPRLRRRILTLGLAAPPAAATAAPRAAIRGFVVKCGRFHAVQFEGRNFGADQRHNIGDEMPVLGGRQHEGLAAPSLATSNCTAPSLNRLSVSVRNDCVMSPWSAAALKPCFTSER